MFATPLMILFCCQPPLSLPFLPMHQLNPFYLLGNPLLVLWCECLSTLDPGWRYTELSPPPSFPPSPLTVPFVHVTCPSKTTLQYRVCTVGYSIFLLIEECFCLLLQDVPASNWATLMIKTLYDFPVTVWWVLLSYEKISRFVVPVITIFITFLRRWANILVNISTYLAYFVFKKWQM
jgi:hypothetical protein